MNDKIRKIAERCGSTHKPNLGVYQFFEAELETFVREIISECAIIVQDFYREDRFNCDNAAEEIKRYFGIES